MQRRALLPLLALLLAAWSLASCGSAPTGPAALAPSPIPAETSPSPTCTFTPAPGPTPSPMPSPTFVPTLLPTCSPSPALRPTPSSLPLPAPVAGDPLPLSLDWRFDANGHLTGGAIAPLSGRPTIVLASLGRTVYALGEDGEVVWRARTAGPIYALEILDDDWLAVGDDAGFVTLLDGRGRQLWQRDLGSRITVLCNGWRGGLLAGSWDERLTSLSASGEVQWVADLGGPVSGLARLAGLVVAATLEGKVRAFDASGAEAWLLDVGAPVTNLEGEHAAVLVGVQDGRLLALDGEGTLRWQQTLGTGGPIWYAADIVADAAPEIAVGSGGATPLLALLSADGEMLWSIAVPSPVGAITALDVDGDGEREILAGLASGQVQAYDGQGRLRGSVHAGLPVWDLEAADDGTALILADVVAWRLAGVDGPSGGAWLPPPAMAPAPPDLLPPGLKRAEGEAILVFVGDVAPGRSMEAQLARYGPAYPWQGLGALLGEADLAVANLECVLTTRGKPLDKPYLIRAHPRWGRTLAAAGFDVLSLANNHALDYGPAGLDETLATLGALDIGAVGVGPSRGAAHRPALFTLNGVRLAVLGYAAARWNGSADVPPTDRLAWAEPQAVQTDVQAVRDQAEVIIVLLHAGTEYAAEPSPDQVAVAHAALEAGADLVVGHHPHVTQTVERYGQGLIVYSLGNALFDIPRPAAMRGHLLRVHVTRQGLVQAELWPFWIEDAIRPRLLDDGQGGPRFRVVYP